MKEYIYDNTKLFQIIANHMFHLANLAISAVLLASGTDKATVVIGFISIFFVNTIINYFIRKSEITVFALGDKELIYQEYRVPYNHIMQVIEKDSLVKVIINKTNFIEIPNIHKLKDGNEFLQELKAHISQ
jgi:hypothetical protein